MDSVNRQLILRRVGDVYDVAAGAQSTEKGLKKYVKALLKAAGVRDQNAGSAQSFLRDFVGGI